MNAAEIADRVRASARASGVPERLADESAAVRVAALLRQRDDAGPKAGATTSTVATTRGGRREA